MKHLIAAILKVNGVNLSAIFYDIRILLSDKNNKNYYFVLK